MIMTGKQFIAASRQRVWAALNDPEILRASIPGCQSLDKETGDRFSATVEVKIGPISARFKGGVSLTELDPPNGYTLVLQGNGGMAGSVKGSAQLQLGDDAGGTLISYQVDAQVGGRMAQLGGPLIDATARQLAEKFFSRLGDIVSAVAQPGAPPLGQIAPSRHSGERTGGFATPSPARGGLSLVWVLSTVVAILAGFLIGRNQHAAGSDWMGLAIGLLVVVVAGAAFDYGRRSAVPVVTLDRALLRQLIEAAKE